MATRRLPFLSLALSAAAALWGCTQLPAPPSPQKDLPPAKLAGMNRVWTPMMEAIRGNCLQCHEAAYIQDRAGFARNTAWLGAMKVRNQPVSTLPSTVSYEDILDVVRFVGEHYGVYHLAREADMEKYNAMLKKGLITADPADGTAGHVPLPGVPQPPQPRPKP